eukprot:8121149-Lingulodinium_polyedra.AAC.1
MFRVGGRRSKGRSVAGEQSAAGGQATPRKQRRGDKGSKGQRRGKDKPQFGSVLPRFGTRARIARTHTP